MASIVLRKDGRAEIRESYTTPRGPRSRTLAVFRELTDRDLDKAEQRASGPFDRARILERARALGVPRFGESASRAARALLAELQADRPLAPVLVGALRAALASRPGVDLPESASPLLPWLAADEAERGEVMRESARAASARSMTKASPGDEKLVRLVRELETAGLSIALAGRLALGYYTLPTEPHGFAPGADAFQPLFVFESVRRIDRLLAALEAAGLELDHARVRERLCSSVSVSLEWEGQTLHLTVAHHPYHRAMQRRVRHVAFGEDAIPIVSAEDLLVTLAVAGLPADPVPVGGDGPGVLPRLADLGLSWWTGRVEWVEGSIQQILVARVGELDLEYVRGWLDRLLSAGDRRRLRFGELAAGLLGDASVLHGTTLTCRAEVAEGWVVNQIVALPGRVDLPAPDSDALARLTRGRFPTEGARRAELDADPPRIRWIPPGTYTVVATAYELRDPRNRSLTTQVVTLEEGVETAEVSLRF